MIEALSLPCHYKVLLDTDKNSYHFITSGKAEYAVFFQQSNEIFSDTKIDGADIYSVSVIKTLTGDGLRDPEVFHTVNQIVEHFFLIKNRILLYTCDFTDDRHLLRDRLFNSWYAKSHLNKRLIKLDAALSGEITIKTSLIFDSSNDLGVDNITESFNEVYEILESSK